MAYDIVFEKYNELEHYSENLVNILKKMLNKDPLKRIPIQQIL